MKNWQFLCDLLKKKKMKLSDNFDYVSCWCLSHLFWFKRSALRVYLAVTRLTVHRRSQVMARSAELALCSMLRALPGRSCFIGDGDSTLSMATRLWNRFFEKSINSFGLISSELHSQGLYVLISGFISTLESLDFSRGLSLCFCPKLEKLKKMIFEGHDCKIWISNDSKRIWHVILRQNNKSDFFFLCRNKERIDNFYAIYKKNCERCNKIDCSPPVSSTKPRSFCA